MKKGSRKKFYGLSTSQNGPQIGLDSERDSGKIARKEGTPSNAGGLSKDMEQLTYESKRNKVGTAFN